MCLIEELFPTSNLDIQVHLLIHLVDKVELAGTMHTFWMFFLERFMKVLKGYVRQKARPEGSMAEGWLVHESTFYITEFLTQINPSLPRYLEMENEDERIQGDKPQGLGKWHRFTKALREKVNIFCISNSDQMVKWMDLYDNAHKEHEERRRYFRATNRGRPYPEELEALPKNMRLEWLEKALIEEERRGGTMSKEEWEFSRGCDFKVLYINIKL